jgi:integrase
MPQTMRKAEAETILAAELAAVNGGPLARVADGTLSFGEWMRNFYIPMRGANWRPATRRSNDSYLKKQIYPRLEYVALKDITKFQVQMLFNQLATAGYSYNVVYHVRDIIKSALAEAVDQEVLESNVARKTVISEIEEREKPALPVEWYAKLLPGLRIPRDRAIFLIASFCALRPSEIFGLTWGSYQGSLFKIMNTDWRGQFQAKKIKRKNRYGRSNYRLVAIPEAVRHAIEEWRRECRNTEENTLMFPGIEARGRKPLDKPMHPYNWLRLRFYPLVRQLKIPFHPTFQVLRRGFSSHGKQEAHPTEMQAQLGHSDIRTTLDPEVLKMANQVTNRILALGEDAEQTQFSEGRPLRSGRNKLP